MSNFWIVRQKQYAYLKVVKWAQRNKVKIETLTKQQIVDVLKFKED
jgi:hypothetical protein